MAIGFITSSGIGDPILRDAELWIGFPGSKKWKTGDPLKEYLLWQGLESPLDYGGTGPEQYQEINSNTQFSYAVTNDDLKNKRVLGKQAFGVVQKVDIHTVLRVHTYLSSANFPLSPPTEDAEQFDTDHPYLLPFRFRFKVDSSFRANFGWEIATIKDKELKAGMDVLDMANLTFVGHDNDTAPLQAGEIQDILVNPKTLKIKRS
jgi:hypothetical protein